MRRTTAPPVLPRSARQITHRKHRTQRVARSRITAVLRLSPILQGRQKCETSEITGLTKIFGIHQTVDQAIAAKKGRR